MPDGAERAHSHHHDHGHDHVHADTPGIDHLGIETFGVSFAVVAPTELMPRIRTVLPPGSQEKELPEEHEHFFLQPQENQVYNVTQGDNPASGSSDLQIALEVLDTRLRRYIALQAPAHIFVHAGVVGHGGRAIVIPGASFSGKTTLVAELVRAGAAYYSDEYAVLDEAGIVHPYPKLLSMRSGGISQVDHGVETIGGTAGVEPLPIGLVAVTSYSPDARWEPRRLSSGEAVLAVLENTVPAQERPEQAMSAITKAVNGAVALHGDRGEATAAVPDILAALNEGGSPSP
jgi:hypothetical protein